MCRNVGAVSVLLLLRLLLQTLSGRERDSIVGAMAVIL